MFSFKSNILSVLLVVFLIIIFGANLNLTLEKRAQNEEYEKVKEKLDMLIDEYEEKVARLEADINDPEYLRRIAVEKYNYREQNDIIFYNDMAE